MSFLPPVTRCRSGPASRPPSRGLGWPGRAAPAPGSAGHSWALPSGAWGLPSHRPRNTSSKATDSESNLSATHTVAEPPASAAQGRGAAATPALRRPVAGRPDRAPGQSKGGGGQAPQLAEPPRRDRLCPAVTRGCAVAGGAGPRWSVPTSSLPMAVALLLERPGQARIGGCQDPLASKFRPWGRGQRAIPMTQRSHACLERQPRLRAGGGVVGQSPRRSHPRDPSCLQPAIQAPGSQGPAPDMTGPAAWRAWGRTAHSASDQCPSSTHLRPSAAWMLPRCFPVHPRSDLSPAELPPPPGRPPRPPSCGLCSSHSG